MALRRADEIAVENHRDGPDEQTGDKHPGGKKQPRLAIQLPDTDPAQGERRQGDENQAQIQPAQRNPARNVQVRDKRRHGSSLRFALFQPVDKRVVVVGSFVRPAYLGASAAPAVVAWAAKHSAANEGGEQDKKED